VPRPRRAQRGSVLAIGSLLLLLITLMWLITAQQATTESRLAGNNLDHYLAFQAAEAALREGESVLEQAALPVFGGSGLYSAGATSVPGPMDFTDSNSVAYSRTIDGVGKQPRYRIQELASAGAVGDSAVLGTYYSVYERSIYRVTAIGYGRTTTTRVIVQSTYRR
jgi:type IV pilus assembly protein PilX